MIRTALPGARARACSQNNTPSELLVWQTPTAYCRRPGSATFDGVHNGFAQDAMLIPVDMLVQWNGLESDMQTADVLFTGHSAGGAVAELCALPFIISPGKKNSSQDRVFAVTFGAPAVAYDNASWVEQYAAWKQPKDHLFRFYATDDCVPYSGCPVGMSAAFESCIRVNTPRNSAPNPADPKDTRPAFRSEERLQPCDSSITQILSQARPPMSELAENTLRPVSAGCSTLKAAGTAYTSFQHVKQMHSMENYLSLLAVPTDFAVSKQQVADPQGIIISPLIPDMDATLTSAIGSDEDENGQVWIRIEGHGQFASPVTAILRFVNQEFEACNCKTWVEVDYVPYVPCGSDETSGYQLKRQCGFELRFNVTDAVLTLPTGIQSGDEQHEHQAPGQTMLFMSNGFTCHNSPVEVRSSKNVAFLGTTGAGKSQLIEALAAHLDGSTARQVDDGVHMASDAHARRIFRHGVSYYELAGFAETGGEWRMRAADTLAAHPPQVLVIVTNFHLKTTEGGMPAAVARFTEWHSQHNKDSLPPILLVITKAKKESGLSIDAAMRFKSKINAIKKAMKLHPDTETVCVNSIRNDEGDEEPHGLDVMHEKLEKLRIRMDRIDLRMSFLERTSKLQ
eukprot:jgi/Tetstr1/443857/TSEL_031811.t1